MLKKTLIITLALVLAFSLVACSGNGATDDSTQQETITISPTAPDTVTNALTEDEVITINTTFGTETGTEALTLDKTQQAAFNEIFNGLTLERRGIPQPEDVPTGGGYYVTIAKGDSTTGYSFIAKDIVLIDGAYYEISDGDFDAIVDFCAELLKDVETTTATSDATIESTTAPVSE